MCLANLDFTQITSQKHYFNLKFYLLTIDKTSNIHIV